MSDNYGDIMVRDSKYEGRGGVNNHAGASIDIIPYGQNLLSIEKAADEYDNVLCDANSIVETEQQCNCYVRAKNTSEQYASEGNVRLFLMPYNVFANPQQWAQPVGL